MVKLNFEDFFFVEVYAEVHLGYVVRGSTACKVQKDFKCGSTKRNVA